MADAVSRRTVRVHLKTARQIEIFEMLKEATGMNNTELFVWLMTNKAQEMSMVKTYIHQQIE